MPDMILLRERLAKLLQKQHRGIIETWEETTGFRQSQYLEKADEIIELFVEAIRNLEFGVPKHYHEKINSAFIFPPCKSFKGKLETSSSMPDGK